MAWHDGLNPNSQTFGIAASGSARVRVMAGPGTGKSFAMKRRVARLLESGVDPRQILAVTFTRVAADDLHRELVQMGVPRCDELKGQTLHSLGLKILSRQSVLAALGRQPRPLNRFEEQALICDLAGQFGGKRPVGRLLQAYNAAWAQAQGVQPGYPQGSQEQLFANAVLSWMHFHQSMLIGEIVPYLLVYLANNPLAPELTEFSHILVDEFQDLNQAEQRIIELLAQANHACIVGDDDQSIYSFKFANPDGIRDWHLTNPGTVDFQLADCHRCPETVVDMANALIAHNQARTPRALTKIPAKGPGLVSTRQFQTIEAEVAFITQEINNLIGRGTAQPGDIIVLVQRAKIGKLIFDALRDALVPVKSYYEESELDTPAAQEQFALFKLLLNPQDRVALRYLLGLGHGDLRANQYRRLRSYCELHGTAPWDTLVLLSNGQLNLPHSNTLIQRFNVIQAQLQHLAVFVANLQLLVDALFPAANPALSELRFLALEILGLLPVGSNASDLLGEMMERITKPEVPATVHQVRLMSLHKSKGLSSPVVFVAGCVQCLLPKLADPGTPHAQQVASMEEQRRLFYVGITRVKADPPNHAGRLYLTYCRTMGMALAMQAGIAGQTAYGVTHVQPSQFIAQLGNSAPRPIAG